MAGPLCSHCASTVREKLLPEVERHEQEDLREECKVPNITQLRTCSARISGHDSDPGSTNPPDVLIVHSASSVSRNLLSPLTPITITIALLIVLGAGKAKGLGSRFPGCPVPSPWRPTCSLLPASLANFGPAFGQDLATLGTKSGPRSAKIGTAFGPGPF